MPTGCSAEMVRVTEPGGYVAIIVRAVDMPWLVISDYASELKAKVEAPVGSVAQGACADRSLYRRMREAGLIAAENVPAVGGAHCSVQLLLSKPSRGESQW